jgi:Fe-S-cluster containining protein
MSRQQRRQQERELKKVGQLVVRSGLPMPSAKAPVLGLAAIIRAKLRERKNYRRASEAAEIAGSTLDISLKRNPSEIEVACKKCCSFCCHTFVSVMAPEVFHIASTVRRERGAAGVEALIQRCATTANLDLDARHGKHLPCPLLTEATTTAICSVYSHRPLVCRKAASISLEACRLEYDGGEVGIQMPVVNQSLFGDTNLALQIALESCSLPQRSYELSSALRAVLVLEDAEKRWLDGEDVFAGVFYEDTSQGYANMISTLAGQIS